jgi:flagellar basal-body rod protein FlgF
MSFYVTVAGKYINEKRLDMISNNLANSLTSGYKAMKPVFGMVSTEGETTNDGGQLKNTYVSIYDTFIDFSDAAIVDSGATYDMAIVGNGYFVVSGKEGNLYTRNGQFTLDKSNRLVTMNGDLVQGSGGAITIDASKGKDLNVLIENDGSIFLGRDFVDKVKIVDFKDKKGLRPVGKSLFTNENKAEPEIVPNMYAIRQGAFEGSNVNVFREMVEMIDTMRAYESYAKLDQMFGDINTKLVDLGKF